MPYFKIATNSELRRKRLLFDYTEEELPNGFMKPHFNYFSDATYRVMMNRLINHAKKMGMLETDLVNLWHDKLHIARAKAHSIIKGKLPIELWEYVKLSKLIGLSLEHVEVDFIKYESRREESSYGAKIIIKSKGYISFVIILNAEDLYDFEIKFDREQLVAASQRKYFNAVFKALEWYFIEGGKYKEIPIHRTRFLRHFQAKWESYEFDNVKPKNSKK